MSQSAPLILASASPRRHELLSYLGVPFQIVVSGFDESSLTSDSPTELARELALAKAIEVATAHPEAVVLAADTIVVLGDEVIGKPASADDARSTLSRLRGQGHHVITGLAIVGAAITPTLREHTVTNVVMRAYSDTEIEASIAEGTPFDKAGGYGVQDPHLRPVERWTGCYCNVMGLPLYTVASMLGSTGIDCGLDGLPERCTDCAHRPDTSSMLLHQDEIGSGSVRYTPLLTTGSRRERLWTTWSSAFRR